MSRKKNNKAVLTSISLLSLTLLLSACGSGVTEQPQEVVAAEPVRLLEDVQYARAGQRGIVALKKDGSVWWWGEVRTTSAKIAENTVGVRYAKPEKMLEDARYVTCGNFCAAAIKKRWHGLILWKPGFMGNPVRTVVRMLM